ncbi:MAG TPA: hypothetical protein VFV70_14705 [Hyphomonadaceae bacterium]|nr:hypothetical protein [Hyphomonadaceae bacterium]
MNLTPEIWYGIGAAVLVLGIIYGWVRYATRDKRKDRLTESATRILYNSRTRDDPVEPPSPDEIAKQREEQRPSAPR